MSMSTLILRYTAFAVIATLANLGTQRVVLAWREDWIGFAAAVFAGTLIGLVVKYALDKRWIFFDRVAAPAEEGRKFGLYTAMGLVTTAIFWGTETAFWLVWQTDLMRETGAVIGLTVGYVVKYRLDRRFVFGPAGLAGAAGR